MSNFYFNPFWNPPEEVDVQFADPTVLAIGTVANGTTSLSVGIPAVTVNEGDYIYIPVGTKLQGARPNTPSEYKCIKGDTINWNDGNGTNVGPVELHTYEKRAVGGESGNVAITFPGANANSILGAAIVFRPDTGAYFSSQTVAGGHKIMDISVGAGTDIMTFRSWNKVNARTGDYILIAIVVNISTTTFSEQTLTGNAALTVSTVTQELLDAGTIQGNDQKMVMSLFKIDSGTSDDYMTFTMKASATSTRSPVGVCHFIRIRQTVSEPSYVPSRAQVSRGYDFITAAADNANTGALDFMAWDKEGTPIGPTLTLESLEGVTHIVSHQDFTEATLDNGSVQRRSEIGKSPRQPRYEPATKLFDSFRNKTFSLGTPFAQFIFWQNHTGSQGIAPNHPDMYMEWGQVGQQGIDINLDPVIGIAGALVVAINTSRVGGGDTTSTRIYYVFNDITIMGTKDHRFELLLRFDIIGRVFLRHNGITLIDRSDIKTIAQTSEELGSGIVGTGSVPLVGGIGKGCGGYFHTMSTYAHCQSWIAAGFPEFKVYTEGIGNCIKIPSDPDYGDEYDIQTLDYIAIT